MVRLIAAPQLVAVLGAQGESVKAAELLDVRESLRGKRRLSFKGVQHDAFQKITQAHVLLLGNRLQHLQHALFDPDSGLHALHLDGMGDGCASIRHMVHIYHGT